MTLKKTIYPLFLMILSIFFIGCSNDDDSGTVTKGSPSALVAGTYKGVYGSNDFNKPLYIDDLGNNKIRIYGNDKTPVEIEVQYVSEETSHLDVMHKTGELGGVFIYSADNKTLNFSGRKLTQDQVLIFFKGTKE